MRYNISAVSKTRGSEALIEFVSAPKLVFLVGDILDLPRKV